MKTTTIFFYRILIFFIQEQSFFLLRTIFFSFEKNLFQSRTIVRLQLCPESFSLSNKACSNLRMFPQIRDLTQIVANLKWYLRMF